LDEKIMPPELTYEIALWNQGIQWIAGIDEAGRGPLAGPVVAAAVIFPPYFFLPQIDDSKKLRPEMREVCYDMIFQSATAIGIGLVEVNEIDQLNIHQASFEAMRRAIASLSVLPQHLLVDGFSIPEVSIPQTAIVKGDQKCFTIASASILAKVTRDRMMLEYDKQYPMYGFARHKGYGTREHVKAILKYGPCEIHRKSFRLPSFPPNQ